MAAPIRAGRARSRRGPRPRGGGREQAGTNLGRTAGKTMTDGTGPLHGIRVLDLATLFAGPMAAMLLGDYGADVVKVEHPRRPDPSRGHGAAKDGVSLWWKVLGRNKRTTAIDLSTEEGQELLVELAAGADVVIENFRPGTLERWNLGYDRLSTANPGLVLARVTGRSEERGVGQG